MTITSKIRVLIAATAVTAVAGAAAQAQQGFPTSNQQAPTTQFPSQYPQQAPSQFPQQMPQQQQFPQQYPPQAPSQFPSQYPPQTPSQYPPQQPNPMAPTTSGFGQQQPFGDGSGALGDVELADSGVAATSELHSGAMHGATPNSIPGGKLITTQELVAIVQGQTPYLIFDVLGGPDTLPGAISLVPAHQAGTFDDQIQQQLRDYLQQMTGGSSNATLVFYCLSTECWMSYNAALRAINLGYTNVLWYRGGIEAWQQAGLPTQSSYQQFQPQQQGGYGPSTGYPQQQGGYGSGGYPQSDPEYSQER